MIDPRTPPDLAGPEADPPCRKLRTKLAFSALIDAEGLPLQWQRGDGSCAVYWCLRTMECAGPDDGLVHASECRPDRSCYQRPEGLDPAEQGA